MGDNQRFENQKRRILVEKERTSNTDLQLTLCGIDHFASETQYGPKTLNGYSLAVILSGEGSAIINGQELKNLHSGQIFLLRPNDTLQLIQNPSHLWTYCWVTFDGNSAASLMEEAGFTDGTIYQNCYVDLYEFFRLTEMILTHSDETVASRLLRHGILYLFVSLAIESNRRNPRSRCDTTDRKHSRMSYIDHAVEFISNNYSKISIENVSSYLGIHRSYLSKLFREQKGCTPNDFLLMCRMQRSAELLSQTDLSIREIGETVGYEDPLTFSKAFKRYYHLSPKFYRRMPEADQKALEGEIAASKPQKD